MMALVQYRNEVQKTELSRRMFAPKKAADINAWFKEARKVIPQIPNPKDTDWVIFRSDASLNYISFEMYNSVGERCYVVIARKHSPLGT